MKHVLASITLMVMLPAFGMAHKHAYQWQNGSLAAEHRRDVLVGIGGTNTTNKIGNTVVTNHNAGASYDVYEVYVINGDDGIQYTAEQALKWRWSHSADLIVNDPVKFRVAGRTLFLKGSDSKPTKCHIMERARINPQPQSANSKNP